MAVKWIQDCIWERVYRYAIDNDGSSTLPDECIETIPASTLYAAFENRCLECPDLTENIQNETDSLEDLAENLGIIVLRTNKLWL
jgi:hypothetical protein